MWFGVVWCGVVWCGLVWFGMVWCGVVWCGVVWCGVVWCGVVWCGVVWCGVVWCGVVWYGVVWCGVVWDSECKTDTSPYFALISIWHIKEKCYGIINETKSIDSAFEQHRMNIRIFIEISLLLFIFSGIFLFFSDFFFQVKVTSSFLNKT